MPGLHRFHPPSRFVDVVSIVFCPHAGHVIVVVRTRAITEALEAGSGRMGPALLALALFKVRFDPDFNGGQYEGPPLDGNVEAFVGDQTFDMAAEEPEANADAVERFPFVERYVK